MALLSATTVDCRCVTVPVPSSLASGPRHSPCASAPGADLPELAARLSPRKDPSLTSMLPSARARRSDGRIRWVSISSARPGRFHVPFPPSMRSIRFPSSGSSGPWHVARRVSRSRRWAAAILRCWVLPRLQCSEDREGIRSWTREDEPSSPLHCLGCSRP